MPLEHLDSHRVLEIPTTPTSTSLEERVIIRRDTATSGGLRRPSHGGAAFTV
jgi:hypothetical protein